MHGQAAPPTAVSLAYGTLGDHGRAFSAVIWGSAAVPQVDLDTPVQFVRGVGPVRARHFASLGVRTAGDLIEHLPFRYELLPKSVPIGQLKLDETATVIGGVASVRPTRGRGGSVVAELADGTGRCRVKWFNASYMADRVQRGDNVRVTGKVGVYRDRAEFVNPRFEILDAGKDPLADDLDRFEPVYPACADLDSRAIRRLITGLLPSVADRVDEILPEALRARRGLPPRKTAYLRVHCPIRLEDAEIARRRLAYDELLLLQMVIQLVRARRGADRSATPIQVTELIDRRIRGRFPFRFTEGQEAAVASITADLREPRPMNRLLQGDVGAGKTAVALYAALAAIANGLQVALLAPTEVLAGQHFDKVRQYLEGSRVRLDLLTGGTPARRRSEILRVARSGELDLLIGTHALIEENVTFGRLGLVVIDEQHKFGMAQRASVRGKGASPHCLVMTATPIPRTLAMTLFGDLDVATIADRPPGRRSVKTSRVRSAEMNKVWGFVRARLSEGERAYVVYPAVVESDALPLRAAATEVERLRAGPLAAYEIALLHGRMNADEKERAMAAFRHGDVQVLVSTTVIEVGVDVPEATVMIVEQAERFGLSQLHQLRGRIGRGDQESHCILVSDAVDENACGRLDALCRTDDGFRIAEEDLRLRGPGEVLGKRQHGLPELKIADPIRDVELLEATRDDAAALIAGDPKLCDRSHGGLRQALMRRFGSFLPAVELALA